MTTEQMTALVVGAGTRPHMAVFYELANRWVDMAQRQVDVPPALCSARAEGTAEALRLCALMLRELLANTADVA